MEEYRNLRMWKTMSAEEQKAIHGLVKLEKCSMSESLLTDQRFKGKLTQLKHYMYLQLNIYKYIFKIKEGKKGNL